MKGGLVEAIRARSVDRRERERANDEGAGPADGTGPFSIIAR